MIASSILGIAFRKLFNFQYSIRLWKQSRSRRLGPMLNFIWSSVSASSLPPPEARIGEMVTTHFSFDRGWRHQNKPICVFGCSHVGGTEKTYSLSVAKPVAFRLRMSGTARVSEIGCIRSVGRGTKRGRVGEQQEQSFLERSRHFWASANSYTKSRRTIDLLTHKIQIE